MPIPIFWERLPLTGIPIFWERGKKRTTVKTYFLSIHVPVPALVRWWASQHWSWDSICHSCGDGLPSGLSSCTVASSTDGSPVLKQFAVPHLRNSIGPLRKLTHFRQCHGVDWSQNWFGGKKFARQLQGRRHAAKLMRCWACAETYRTHDIKSYL